MSELENIVHHIVQHEEERQAEKIKLESEIKALEEVLEHGISTKFVEEEVIYVYSPKTAHDMREKLEENYKQFHTQLTIPKSIAEKTVGYFNNDRPNSFERSTLFVGTQWSSDINGDDFDEKEFDKRIQIVGAYLNPLTRDLVKVVEGWNETILGN